MKNTALGFGVFLFAVFFGWIALASELPNYRHLEYVAWFLAGAVIFLAFLFKNRPFFDGSEGPFWFFLLTMCAGIVSAAEIVPARETLIKFVLFLPLTFYFGKMLLRFERIFSKIAVIICLFSFVVSAVAVCEIIFKTNFLYEKYILNEYYGRYIGLGRPVSTLFNPVILGTFLLFSIPFNVFLVKKRKGIFQKIVLFNLILNVAILLSTGSRGVFLAFISMMLFCFIIRGKKRQIVYLVAGVFFFIFICSFFKQTVFYRYGFRYMLSSQGHAVFSDYRTDRLKMTWRIFRAFPLSGVGFQHFRIRFAEFNRGINSSDISYEFQIPDNAYLTFLSETGLIGFCGFLFFIFDLFFRGLRSLKKSTDREGQIELFLLLSIFAGFLVHMAAYEFFYWVAPFFLFALASGMIQQLILSDKEISRNGN